MADLRQCGAFLIQINQTGDKFLVVVGQLQAAQGLDFIRRIIFLFQLLQLDV